MKEEIIPLVEANYRTTADRGIAGWSMSGLFGAYALLNSPETFQRYLLVSPSVQWMDGLLVKQAAKLAIDGPQKDRNVFIAFGTDDDKPLMESSQEFARVLRKQTNAQVVLRTAEGENHFTALAINYGRGMRTLYPPPPKAPNVAAPKPQ